MQHANALEATAANETIPLETVPPVSEKTPESSINTLPSYASQKPGNRYVNEPATLQPAAPRHAKVNLWQIETRQQVFSPVILSPTRRWMAFTEMRYLSPLPQVFARAYMAPLSQGPPNPYGYGEAHPLPEDQYVAEAMAALAQKRLQKTAQKHVQQQSDSRWCRWGLFCKEKATVPPPPVSNDLTPANPAVKEVYRADAPFGEAQAFRSLIPVDWSQDGQILLFKEIQGHLYQGVQQQMVATLDAPTGTATLYPELNAAVGYYWQQRGIQPPLETFSWQLNPIGWQPGSSQFVEIEAWGYTMKARLFLGHWRLNISTRQLQMMSETYNPQWPVASNGALVVPIESQLPQKR